MLIVTHGRKLESFAEEDKQMEEPQQVGAQLMEEDKMLYEEAKELTLLNSI